MALKLKKALWLSFFTILASIVFSSVALGAEVHIHTFKTVPALPATCTKTGLTEGIACSGCDYVLKEQELVPAKGHYEVSYDAVLPSCEEDGHTAGTICTVCGLVLEGLQEIPALGHVERVIYGIKPTCTEDGSSNGKVCSVCKKVLIEQTILPPTGHRPVVDNAVSPTCQNFGYTEGKHCIYCSMVIIPQEIIPKSDHQVITTQSVPATCEAAGRTAQRSCAVCSMIFEVSKTIPALGHSPKSGTVKATAKKDGQKYINCTTCGKIISKTAIPKISDIYLTETAFKYTGKTITPKVRVLDSKGKELKSGTDYTLSYSGNRINAGKPTVKVTFKGNYSGSETLAFTISPGKTTVKFTATADSITLKWTEVKGAYGYRVYLYNARTKKWKTLIKATKATSHTFKSLQSGTDYKYSVKAYSRIDGAAVWGEGKRITASTKPAATRITLIESETRGTFTLNWEKVSGATGYVVYYKEGKNGKYKNVKTTANSLTQTKLKRGKKYYVRIRAFKKSSAGNLYSAYTPTKTVYVKG